MNCAGTGTSTYKYTVASLVYHCIALVLVYQIYDGLGICNNVTGLCLSLFCELVLVLVCIHTHTQLPLSFILGTGLSDIFMTDFEYVIM